MKAATTIVCSECAAVNRVSAGRDLKPARCGRCKAPLFRGRPAEADARMFERQVSRSTLPVLVDIWAPWCGPCRIMAPAFADAAAELEPRVRLIKLNSDEHGELAARLGIRGIPALLLFRDGRELARLSGAMGTAQIVAWVEGQLASAG
ncbi:thioredoxin TrxC [Pontibaca methylaminivorans]|uniref:Thioredoxin n=1 Tax=Pontibaca methylaminivorans TaxID=515897 RepID=A0A1R3WY05_9RHOB|nr:thioredoxin TrxC [Pontibaca methylaminivorans]SIT83427.1 thioredoxin [Pontibaca methylaminivorans]